MHVPPVPEQQEIARTYHSDGIDTSDWGETGPISTVATAYNRTAIISPLNPRFNATMLVASPTTAVETVAQLTQLPSIQYAVIARTHNCLNTAHSVFASK